MFPIHQMCSWRISQFSVIQLIKHHSQCDSLNLPKRIGFSIFEIANLFSDRAESLSLILTKQEAMAIWNQKRDNIRLHLRFCRVCANCIFFSSKECFRTNLTFRKKHLIYKVQLKFFLYEISLARMETQRVTLVKNCLKIISYVSRIKIESRIRQSNSNLRIYNPNWISNSNRGRFQIIRTCFARIRHKILA